MRVWCQKKKYLEPTRIVHKALMFLVICSKHYLVRQTIVLPRGGHSHSRADVKCGTFGYAFYQILNAKGMQESQFSELLGYGKCPEGRSHFGH